MQVFPTSTYNTHTGVIGMQMDATTDNGSAYATITFQFSRPVKDLTFTVADIDGGTGGNWNDRVEFSPVPSLVSKGSNVSYNGTTGVATANGASISGTQGDLRIRFPNALTSVTVKWVASNASGSNPDNQIIFIDDLTYIAVPLVALQKTTNGGTGAFSFSQTNLESNPPTIVTTTSGTPAPATPSQVNVSSLGTNVTITETPAAGYTLTDATCVDANSSVTGNTGLIGTRSGSTLTIPGANILEGADFQCVLTNTRAVVRIQKITRGGYGGPFSFTQTNLTNTPATISTSAANTVEPATPAADAVSSLGLDVTVTESAASGFALTRASCVDTNASVTGNSGSFGTLSGSTLTIPATRVVSGAEFTCIFDNAKIPTVSVQKVTNGNVGGPFSFNATNLVSALPNISTTSPGVAAPASPTAVNVTTIGQAVTITETVASGYEITAASCTDANSGVTGNTGNFGTLSGSTLSIAASRVVPGAQLQCTFTNRKIPKVKLQKVTLGGTGGPFTYSATNLASTPASITTSLIGVAAPASPSAIQVVTTGSAVTITETVASGYKVTSASCTDDNSAITGNTGTFGTLSGSTLTIPATNVVAGAEFNCTFTNSRIPTLALQKLTLGSSGGPFSFLSTNLVSTPGSITTTSVGTSTPASPTPVNVSVIGQSVTLTETTASGYAIVSASCIDANNGVTGNTGSFGTLSGSTLTIAASRVVPDAQFQCSFTNRKIPTVKLQKVTLGGAGGPFTFAATNLASAPAGITTTVASTATPATPSAIQITTNGADVTISETVASGYFITSATCTDANSAVTGNIGTIGTLSGTTYTIPGAAVVDGADFTCIFTNTLAEPKLAVAKSASVASVNVAGASITYTMTVSNTGNVTVASISVSDPLGTVTCSTSGNASVASLAPGASETCSMTYTVTQADLDSNGGGDGDIDNTATASGTYDGTTVQASGSASVALLLSPGLSVTKTANDTTDVVAGQVITYTYVVTNTGNQTVINISLSDSHNGAGPAPVPGSETLSTDAGTTGDSTDATANNGVWSSLAPGDAVTFTATYTVLQTDVDTRQ